MGEEIRKPEMELNEAALEGVSGGDDPLRLNRVRSICARCKKHSPDACNGGSVERLAAFPGPVSDYSRCPYYDYTRSPGYIEPVG